MFKDILHSVIWHMAVIPIFSIDKKEFLFYHNKISFSLTFSVFLFHYATIQCIVYFHYASYSILKTTPSWNEFFHLDSVYVMHALYAFAILPPVNQLCHNIEARFPPENIYLYNKKTPMILISFETFQFDERFSCKRLFLSRFIYCQCRFRCMLPW